MRVKMSQTVGTPTIAYLMGHEYEMTDTQGQHYVQAGVATSEGYTPPAMPTPPAASTPAESIGAVRVPPAAVVLPSSLHAHATTPLDAQRLPSNLTPPIKTAEATSTDANANAAHVANTVPVGTVAETDATHTGTPPAEPAAQTGGKQANAARGRGAAAAKATAAANAASSNPPAVTVPVADAQAAQPLTPAGPAGHAAQGIADPAAK